MLLSLALLLIGSAAFLRIRMRGPHRDYRADVSFTSGGPSTAADPLHVGAALREITPRLEEYDTWHDQDGDSRFHPEKGDTWTDRNGNGDFDFVWLAGFNINRPAQGINDPLWARALAFRHRETLVALVSIDCVGLTHERFIEARLRLRQRIPELRHVVFTSTHTHNAPDTMGIWSYRIFPSKFNTAYVDRVIRQAEEAVAEAVTRLEPADTILGSTLLPPDGFVRDSREPLVYDRTLGVARFVRAGRRETIATLVSWGNHPEAMGGNNPLISSDFPHYLREAMEHGLSGPNGAPGFGGICVYFQGPVGGLMTPLGLEVPDRNENEIYKINGVGKARALGENLALRASAALGDPAAQVMTNQEITVVARSVFAPIDGNFKIPIMLGLIHPGWFDGKARTEVDALRIGDIEILTIPGEIYPEIVDGGIEAPDGGDFPGPPLEIPPLRPAMRGKLNLVFNLANDEVGYIIPKTQWDTRPPFTYGRSSAPYGEENSGGPDVARVIHAEAIKSLHQLHSLLDETDQAER